MACRVKNVTEYFFSKKVSWISPGNWLRWICRHRESAWWLYRYVWHVAVRLAATD